MAARRAARSLLIAFVVVLIGLFLVSSTLLDLSTDALWFHSVGFDSVFWTRIGAQAALFVGALVVCLIVLLGNLWLAGRLGPPAGTGGGAIRSIVDRLNDAAEAAAANQGRRDPRYGGRRPDEPRAISIEPDSLPDLGPLATAALAVVGVFIAVLIAAAVGGAWETVLLWQHRVPFSADAAVATTDPIFNKDIGYFLFELPFLRLVQGVFNGLVIAALLLTLGRYLVTASRAGLVFATPVRLHLAVLGALLLLSVAFGYQLDKLELVYSTRGAATGVSYTDFHAQFFAFDALTIISGLAAAFLVGGALTRMLWPLGLTIGVWLLASLVIGRLYPEAVQRFSVGPERVRPGRAVHRQQHRDDPARLRPRRLGGSAVPWRGAHHPGARRRRERHVHERPPVGLPAAQRHPRPAPDRAALLRLHGRRCRPLHDRRCRAPGLDLRSRARPRAEPERGRASRTSGSSSPTASGRS